MSPLTGADKHFLNQLPAKCRGDRIIGYKQFEADDLDSYIMSKHFPEAIEFIENVRTKSGKVLVYCKRGMNRSATICVAYLMAREKMSFLEAVRFVKERRTRVLTNNSFLRQLAEFAKDL